MIQLWKILFLAACFVYVVRCEEAEETATAVEKIETELQKEEDTEKEILKDTEELEKEEEKLEKQEEKILEDEQKALENEIEEVGEKEKEELEEKLKAVEVAKAETEEEEKLLEKMENEVTEQKVEPVIVSTEEAEKTVSKELTTSTVFVTTTTTTTTTTAATITTTKEPGKVHSGMFEIRNAEGKSCLLVDIPVATFTLFYVSKLGEKSKEVKLPRNAKVRGKCENEKESPFIRFTWDDLVFVITFSKVNDGNDNWAIKMMKIEYEMGPTLFGKGTQQGKKTAVTKELQLFSTPFGYSIYCSTPEMIKFYNDENKMVATLKMKDIQMQAFSVVYDVFSEAMPCSQEEMEDVEEPYIQDETVPLAVGLTLAILTLLGVLGFSIYRMKTVKKVDYNTME